MRRSACLAGATAALLQPALGSAAPRRPLRIAVLGDSLALGTGASRADGGFIFPAFRQLLRGHPGSAIDNMAIGGATVNDVLRLECPRLAASRYDIVIICAGGNDVVHRTPPAQFAQTYAALLRRVRSLAPHARLICCGVPDVGRSPIFADEAASVDAASYRDNRAIRSAASASGAAFIDLYALTHALVDATHYLGRDRFHPSDRGYTLFSRALEPALERLADTIS
jgi:acyl-CoA thioesterase I